MKYTANQSVRYLTTLNSNIALTKVEIKNVSGGVFGWIVNQAIKLMPDGDWVYNGGNHRISNKL